MLSRPICSNAVGYSLKYRITTKWTCVCLLHDVIMLPNLTYFCVCNPPMKRLSSLHLLRITVQYSRLILFIMFYHI